MRESGGEGRRRGGGGGGEYGEGDAAVVEDHFFGEKVGTDGGFVRGRELFVDLNTQIHQSPPPLPTPPP